MRKLLCYSTARLPLSGGSIIKVMLAAACGVVAANCSQAPQQGRLSSQESREIGFFSHRKFGPASPRVAIDGDPIPKGGGRDHVGRSYTIAGKRYTPYVKPVGYTITGQASWYGPAFHGRKTANGEVYDRHGVSAAHPTMPLPSYARVTNLANRRSIIVRVNDRGPYHGGRVIDLSQRTADLLEFRHLGTARVKVEYVGRASIAGSDDRSLVASLTTDGTPAGVPGMSQPATLIANAPPLTTPRSIPSTSAAEPASSFSVASNPAVAPPAERAVGNPGDVSRIVRNAPRPPERPFDLATIPGAATPTAFAGPEPAIRVARSSLAGQRPVVASLFFASPEPLRQSFSTNHPLVRDLTPQRFVKLSP
jgi:rare lipoprotein A